VLMMLDWRPIRTNVIVAISLLRRLFIDDTAVEEVDRAICAQRIAWIVSYHAYCGALPVQVRHQCHDRFAIFRIEISRSFFSTRPSVEAVIQQISSETSLPTPRTWQGIDPRLTVSIQTLARSTVGAAGGRRQTCQLIALIAHRTIPP
jgi:hypothetical protein